MAVVVCSVVGKALEVSCTRNATDAAGSIFAAASIEIKSIVRTSLERGSGKGAQKQGSRRLNGRST